MLYYIVPPVIIIIGLAVLVSFLFKKTSQMPREELAVLEARGGRNYRVLSKSVLKGVSQTSLRVLEKLMQRSKLLSLKFHNLFQSWFQSIKKRREKTKAPEVGDIESVKKKAFKEEPVENIRERKIISKISSRREEKIKEYPIISDKVVQPESKSETKDKLEVALVDRVAQNPQDIEAYERLGDYYIERGNNQDALECFRQVLKMSPVHRKAKIQVRKLERIMGK